MRTAEQVLCRFQLSSAIRHGRAALYEWIVESAHREGLRGATVLEGFHGLDHGGAVLEDRFWHLAGARPMIVEVVETAAAVEALLERVEPVFVAGLITLERVHVWPLAAGRHEVPGVAGARGVAKTSDDSAARGVRTMKIPEDGVLLRIFIGESDRGPDEGRPLYDAIVRRARAANLAGATVLRGPMGFGRHSRVHTSRMLDLSTDLPIVIEIVDAPDRIDAFLPEVDALVTEGLVTLEDVRVLKYVSAERR